MPQEAQFLSATQILLTTLVVKLAVVAVLATMLVRFRQFRRILLTERRAWRERLVFAFSLGIPVSAGVAARLLLNYDAADLTLAGAFLAGLIAGPYTGVIVGSLAGAPALMAGEFIALPFAIGCGFAGGGLREACPKEVIWQFSPFVFTSLHKRAWRFIRTFKVDWQVPLLAAPISLELLRQALGDRFGGSRLFYVDATTGMLWVLSLLAVVLSVAVPIKIWNSARIEHRLQEQEQLLMAAKIEALASQINPHFLFNTLTSVSSLIRSEPEMARTVITKLSGLLRRLLRSHVHFVSLREELASIDVYLDIEAVRFGSSLIVEKQVSPESLDVVVPSMILQPLVENSIKHGLARKLGDGRLIIRAAVVDGHTVIEVVDNGSGLSEPQMEQAAPGGIGLKNVNERLRVIYGANYQLKLDSTPGQGTCARIEIPELVAADQITA